MSFLMWMEPGNNGFKILVMFPFVCMCNHLPSTVLTLVLQRLIRSLGSTGLFTLEKTWISVIVIIINCGFIGLLKQTIEG